MPWALWPSWVACLDAVVAIARAASGVGFGQIIPNHGRSMSLIEAPEVEVISTRYRTKRRDKGGVWTSHHARPLDTLRNVPIEVARVYRAMANGKLSSSEGARFTFVLRELRCCLESEALEAENAARKAPAVPSEVNVSIITVRADSKRRIPAAGRTRDRQLGRLHPQCGRPAGRG